MAYESLEKDLGTRSILATMRLIFENVWLHDDTMIILWRYVAEYMRKHSHPLREAINEIYSLLQKQGISTLRKFLANCIEKVAEEIEYIYRRHPLYDESHPVAVGCWDAIAIFYSQEVNHDRIFSVYSQLRDHHYAVEKSYGWGSMEELQLRYCYAFHLCYNPRRDIGEAITYLQEFLDVQRAGDHHDLSLNIWCLQRLAHLNYEASGNLSPEFNMRQGLARHYLEESVKIRIAETARVEEGTDDIRELIEDIMKLETWHQEAGHDGLADSQRKRREACEALFSGVIPISTALFDATPLPLSSLR